MFFRKKENKPKTPFWYKDYIIQAGKQPKNAEEAIDWLLKPFTKDQIKALEVDANNVTVTFRDRMMAYNERRKPLLTNEEYLSEAKADIERFGYMFEQKENLEALRQVFFGRFIQLFD